VVPSRLLPCQRSWWPLLLFTGAEWDPIMSMMLDGLFSVTGSDEFVEQTAAG
jgi:hypothetical protein